MVLELGRLDFVRRKDDLVFTGKAGTGKSHIHAGGSPYRRCGGFQSRSSGAIFRGASLGVAERAARFRAPHGWQIVGE